MKKLHKVNKILLVDFILHYHLVLISNQNGTFHSIFRIPHFTSRKRESLKGLMSGDQVLSYMNTSRHFGGFSGCPNIQVGNSCLPHLMRGSIFGPHPTHLQHFGGF